MRKIWGYEPRKFFYNSYSIITILILCVLNLIYFIWVLDGFEGSYNSWLKSSNSRHVFDFLLGKTAIFNGVTLCIVIIISTSLIYFSEYKRGTITRLNYSRQGLARIFRDKNMFFGSLLLAFYLFNSLLITGFGINLIYEYNFLLGQQKFLISSFVEYFFIYIVFSIRTILLYSLFFKYFRGSSTAFTVLILLQISAMFIPWLPFCIIYTTDLNFTSCGISAIGYSIILYSIDKIKKYA